MAKVKRQIITIDEARCDGCGGCVPSCAEGALQVIDGKARLVKESYCDGLGACLGECPQSALNVVEMEVEAYDEVAVVGHLRQTAPEMVEKHLAHLAGHRPRGIVECQLPIADSTGATAIRGPDRKSAIGNGETLAQAEPPRGRSELRQWPVQLHLVPVQAPFFQDADLLLVADCVPFAYPNLHADFLKDHAIAVGCPKLDDGRAYIAKLTQILRNNGIRSLHVVRMEVPCCGGLEYIAQQALANSGKDIPYDSVIIDIGDV